MTKDRIDKLRKICTDAMNGPWSITRTNNEFFINGGKMCGDEVRVQYNSKFISEARIALPETLDEIDSLRSSIERLVIQETNYRKLLEDRHRYRTALESILEIKLHQGDWTADEMQEIARKALEQK